MKNILYIIPLVFCNIIYSLHYKPIYNAPPLKEIACTKLAYNLINCESQELIKKLDNKELSQELIDTIRRELINENLPLYWDIFKIQIIPKIQALPKNVREGYFHELIQGTDSLLLLQNEFEQINPPYTESKWCGERIFSYPSLEMKSFLRSSEPILSLILVPRTNHLFTAHKDTVCLWDIDQGICIKKFEKVLGSRCYFAINAQRTLLMLYSNSEVEKNSAYYYTLDLTALPGSSLVQILKRDHGSEYRLSGIQFTPQGDFLVATGKQLCIDFLNIATLQWHRLPFKELPNHCLGSSFTVSPDGTLLVATSSFGCYIYDLKNIEKGCPIRQIKLNDNDVNLVVSVDLSSKNIVLINQERMYLWNINNTSNPILINSYPYDARIDYTPVYWDRDKVRIYVLTSRESLKESYLWIYDVEESLKVLSVAELVLIAKLKKFGWKTLIDPYYKDLFENCKHKNVLISYFKIPSLFSTMINTYHRVQNYFHY